MANTIKKFWDWFNANNKSYSFINEVDENVKEQLLNELQDHLHEYCNQLYFEIGGMPGEADQELIITAEGNTDFFEQVETLINNAPVVKIGHLRPLFRPRMVTIPLAMRMSSLSQPKCGLCH